MPTKTNITANPAAGLDRSPLRLSWLKSLPVRISVIYITFGLCWVWFSNFAKSLLGIDAPKSIGAGEVFNSFFVISSGFFVHWFVRREMASIERESRSSLESQDDILVEDESEAILEDSPDRIETTADLNVVTERLPVYQERRALSSSTRPDLGVEESAGSGRHANDRKSAEAAIRESEDRFRSTFEQAAVGIAHVGLDGRYLATNQKLSDLTGYTPEELVQKSFQEITHPDDLANDLACVQELVDGKIGSYALEKRYIRKNGTFVWINLTVSLRRTLSGQPLYFISVIEDISVRKRAEEETRSAKELLRAVLETVPNGVYWKDSTSRYIGCNSRMAHFLGFDNAIDLLGTRDENIPLIRPEQAAEIISTDRAVISTGHSRLGVAESLRRADGETVWFETNKLPLADGDGRVIGVLGTWNDVSERRRIELALRESEENLRMAMLIAGLGVKRIDYRKNTTTLSPRAAELMGFPADTPVPMALVHDRIHPEDRDEFRRLLAISLNPDGPKSFETEYRVVRPDGSIRWLSVRKQITFESGSPSHAICVAADVTERRRAEVAVREKADFVQAVLDAMNSHIAVLDSDGVIIAVNGAWEEFSRQFSPSGRPVPNSLVGSDYLEICEAESRFKNEGTSEVAERIRRVIRGESEHETVDYPFHSPSEQRWFLMNITPVKRGKGEVVVSLTNVTERRRIEVDLRESDERFRAVAEGLADPLYVHDEFGKIQFANPRAIAAHGYTASEFLELQIFDIDAGFDRDDLLALWKKQLDQRPEQLTFETIHRRKDGSTFPVEIRLAMIRWLGKLSFLTTAHDLSERKRVERQLRHQEMLLREAAELAHVGGWAFEPSTRKLDWTPEVFRIHDQDPGVPIVVDEALQYYHGEYRQRIEAAVEDAMTTGKPYDLELQLISARGRRKWVRTTCQPIIENGKVISVRGSLQDLTDRKQLEEQFRQSQKMEAVGRLAGGIAHDFNNLLTVINGYCELLLGLIPVEDENRSLAKEIYHAGERASALTSQLLAFSRKAVISPRVLNLNEVVANSEKLLRRLIGEDISLAFIPDSTACHIEADPNQLDQVLINLAVNARDAMPRGGKLIVGTEVVVVDQPRPTNDGVLQPGCYVRLSVRDTGVGMSEEVLANIFEPFFTTKGAGKGTGLGLAVVHGVVRQAGGEIVVESVPDEGTTFHLYFREACISEDPGDSFAAVQSSRGSETILLAEDDEAVRSLFKMALESQGYKVFAARDGKEAIRTMEKLADPPHILITDVVMPEMSGRELAEVFRAKFPNIPVLFVSGYTDDMILRHGIVEAHEAFLAKPFSPLGLARKVRGVLDKS